MFNNEAYQRRLDELKESIREENLAAGFVNSDEGRSWAKDVSLRYGRFLARNTAQQLDRVIAAFGVYEHVDDKQKYRDYCAQELMGVVAGVHAASAMIRGAVVVADPIGAEAMMRIYEEANGTPRETAPAPMAAEPDFEFRTRVRAAAVAAGADDKTLATIVIASSLELDQAGRNYGLLRLVGVAT